MHDDVRQQSVAALALMACVAGWSSAGCGPARCGEGESTVIRLAGLERLDPPAGSGAEGPNLAAGNDVVWLSWTEPTADQAHAVRVAALSERGWSSPQSVTQSQRLFVNWADVPAMAELEDGTLIATWLESFDGHAGYGVRFAHSRDAGATWSSPAVLADDESGPEYGFVSMAPVEDEVQVFWLDGRMAGQGHAGAMQLHTARVDRHGGLKSRSIVDERVCDCCATAAATMSKGPVVVYRDRSEQEVRDIRLAGPERSAGRDVFDDGWRIEGCPVNGPAVTTVGDRAAVAWFTGTGDVGAVQVAFGDRGAGFEAPHRVDLGHPLGRVDIVAIDAARVAVTWIETESGSDARWLVRTVSKDGTLGAPREIAKLEAARASGFPRAIRFEERLVFVWTDASGSSSRLRAAVAPVERL